jgi:hypothetical protein
VETIPIKNSPTPEEAVLANPVNPLPNSEMIVMSDDPTVHGSSTVFHDGTLIDGKRGDSY